MVSIKRVIKRYIYRNTSLPQETIKKVLNRQSNLTPKTTG